MATPRKTAQGTYRIQIEVRGTRDSGTFPTAREARDWAARRTTELQALAGGRAGEVRTLDQLLERYAEEVTPSKRGWAKELVRIKAFRTTPAHSKLPLQCKLAEITPSDLVAWRDARLKVNARGGVLRDMNLLGAALEKAVEWGWLKTNPLREVKRPAEPDHRERLILQDEIDGMLAQLGYVEGAPVRSVSQAVAMCFLVALETGMRAGELCGLTWDRVHPVHVQLTERTKSGRPREVALTPRAQQLLERMRGWDRELVFGLKAQSLDALFRKARDRAKLAGFTFHDARHTAATRLAPKIQVLDLCRMFGWTNPKMAMRYYNATAADIAARLAA